MVPAGAFIAGMDLSKPGELYIVSGKVATRVDAAVADVFPATLYVEAEMDHVHQLVLEHVASGERILLNQPWEEVGGVLHRTSLYLSPGEYRVLANLIDFTNADGSPVDLYANEGAAVAMDAGSNEAQFAFSIIKVDAGPHVVNAGEEIWVSWEGTPLLFTPLALNNITDVSADENGMLVTVGGVGEASLTFSDGIARHEVLFRVDSLPFRTREEAYTLAAGERVLVAFETMDGQPLQASAMKLNIPDELLGVYTDDGLMVGSSTPGAYVLTADYAGSHVEVAVTVEDRFISMPMMPLSLNVGQSMVVPLSTYSGGFDSVTVKMKDGSEAIVAATVGSDGLTVTGLARGNAEMTVACMGVGVNHEITVIGGFVEPPVLPDVMYIGHGLSVKMAVHGAVADVQPASSDESVLSAMVEDGGLSLFPLSPGSVQVTLRCHGDELLYDITVEPVLTGVTPQAVEVREEESFTLTLGMTEGHQVRYTVIPPDILTITSEGSDTIAFQALAPGNDVIIISDESGQALEVPVTVNAEWRISVDRQQSEAENNALHMALLKWGLVGPPEGVITQEAQQVLMKVKAAFGWDITRPYLTREEYETLLAYKPETTASPSGTEQAESWAPEGEAQVMSAAALGDTYYLLDSQKRLLIVPAGSDHASRVVDDAFVKVVSNGSLVLALSKGGLIFPFGPQDEIDRWFDELLYDAIAIAGMDLSVADMSFSKDSLVMVFDQDGEINEKNKLREVVAGQACVYLQSDKAGSRGVVRLTSVQDALMLEGGGTRHVLLGIGTRNDNAVLYEITGRKTAPATVRTPADMDMDLRVAAVNSDMMVVVDGGGTAYLRGKNKFGQIGNGSTRQSNNFVAAEGVGDVVHAALGDTYALLLTGSGRLYAAGETPAGEQLTSFTLIAEDIRHMAPLADGKVLLVNNAHQIAVTDLSDIGIFRSIYYP